ncbi:Double-stranded RNA-binding domain [Dillenia turbinata]|uniref:Double-stranded RNA-binding domain n=1 Tax=Dillenia turbinata TaxID=194707 RepID=A0AAN8YX21_9MAGN
MYKNQLQELAQRSCFNLPSYACIREGPDHAPRFKATVTFNGEIFESPSFCPTLRQAEHAAAEVALNALSSRSPSKALAARVLDETGIYKNLLQETAHKAGLELPAYTTIRSGSAHVPLFSCVVEIAGMSFTGEITKTKKQAQKNAAMAAWSALKKLAECAPSSSSSDSERNEEQEQVVIARYLTGLHPKELNCPEQNISGQRHQRSVPLHMSSVPPSLYTLQYPNWAYSTFSREMAMYQIMQQEQLSRLQTHLLPLPFPPAAPLHPQILPLMQDQQFFVPPPREQVPIASGSRISLSSSDGSFYFPNNLVPYGNGSTSTASIQEVQVEKTEAACGVSSNQGQNPVTVGGIIPELVNQEEYELEDRHSGQETNIGNHAQLVVNQTTQCLGSEEPRHGHLGFMPQNSHGPSLCRVNIGPPRLGIDGSSMAHSTTASPVMIRNAGSRSAPPRPPHSQNFLGQMPMSSRMRTGVYASSATQWTKRMDFESLPHAHMAPPVQIRSVVPVCSAPPPRKKPGSSEEAPLLDQGQTRNELDDALTASSKLNELQL